MHLLERLPFILGALASLTVGMVSYNGGVSQQSLYMRMAVSMLIFFFVGLYVRSTILGIYAELEEKKKLEEKEKSAREVQGEGKEQESVINYRVGETEDLDFQPLKPGEILKSDSQASAKEKV